MQEPNHVALATWFSYTAAYMSRKVLHAEAFQALWSVRIVMHPAFAWLPVW